MRVLAELLFCWSNTAESQSCSCQLIYSHVCPSAPALLPQALFMICGTVLWHVDWHAQDVLTGHLFIYLFILPILLPAALLPNRQCGDRKCGGSPVSEGGWGEKCALGTRVLALSPHQHILLNLYKHTFRTSTLTYLTLLMRYGEHNQSLPWISSPALCRRWGEENGEFMQS